MTAYLLVSVLTGIVGGAYGLIATGSSVWAMLGWYMIGGWTGLGLMVMAVLVLSLLRGPERQSARAI